jgi:phosphohistidine phosphatase
LIEKCGWNGFIPQFVACEEVSMKKLYLVRHSKSSWDMEGIDDIDRPLLEKGIQKSRKAVKFLNQQQVKIDRIVSSHAVRAFETAKLVAAGIGYPEDKIVVNPRIYGESIQPILDIIYSTDDSVESLMIVGHNPVITMLSNLFLRPGIDFMPTMSIICVSFETDRWSEIPLAPRKNEFVMNPKSFND